jgi:hypothetical protein
MVSPKSFQIRSLAKRPNAGAPIRTELRHRGHPLAFRRPRRPWGTRAPRRYLTARIGGAPGGAVTMTATDTQRVVVEAAWGDRSISRTLTSEREAIAVANAWIDDLAEGREPTS